jgi:hypothetical protein
MINEWGRSLLRAYTETHDFCYRICVHPIVGDLDD